MRAVSVLCDNLQPFDGFNVSDHVVQVLWPVLLHPRNSQIQRSQESQAVYHGSSYPEDVVAPLGGAFPFVEDEAIYA
jgi:hypothetical protein